MLGAWEREARLGGVYVRGIVALGGYLWAVGAGVGDVAQAVKINAAIVNVKKGRMVTSVFAMG